MTRLAFLAYWLAFAVLYAFTVLFVLSRPALAADSTLTIHHDPGPQDAWFARVEIWNEPGSSSFERTLETDRGPVVVKYTTLAGTSGAYEDTDRVEIVSLPEGIVAVPMVVQATEGAVQPDLSIRVCGGVRMEYRAFAEDNWALGEIRLNVLRRGFEHTEALTNLSWQQVADGEVKPFVELRSNEGRAFLQAMMDAAYAIGLRPSRAQDERHLKAHLEDMRKITMHTLGVEGGKK